ncbi:hypothetical protein GCM10008986_20460 [Salinibacillus aidingensis]|uniref:Tripartite tricarboxylate transporter TctB family protein n=1 Tax=Salinibacillus aidingensis TaxID=237684 RepID=A0ABN1BAW2_9BACI
MPKGLKIMLFWSLVFPTIITILRIITDYVLGKEIELFSYTAVFLGIGAGGLIFVGPLMYFVSKSKEKKINSLAVLGEEIHLPNKQRSIGLVSFISLIIGIISSVIYILTGNSFINDSLTMLFSFVFLILSFVLSLFSKKDKFGRISLYIFPVLLVIYLLFFGVMSVFWKQPE